MTLEHNDFEFTEETTFIRGFWLDLGSQMVKDSGWSRIEWLIENRLELLIRDQRNTDALYINRRDNRLWHYYSVAPGIKDGGPPVLEMIDKVKAEEIFGNL